MSGLNYSVTNNEHISNKITIDYIKNEARKMFPNRKLIKVVDIVDMNFYELVFALQSPEVHHNEPTLPCSPVIDKDSGELKWWDLLDDIEYKGKRIEIELNKME